MRKYAIASLAAVAAFSMSAFAATLVVDGGALQAGSDNTLYCASTATTSYVMQTDIHNVPSYWVDAIDVAVNSSECASEYATVTGYDASGAQLFGGVSGDNIGDDGVVRVDLVDGQVRADEVERIDVLIKTGNSDRGAMW